MTAAFEKYPVTTHLLMTTTRFTEAIRVAIAAELYPNQSAKSLQLYTNGKNYNKRFHKFVPVLRRLGVELYWSKPAAVQLYAVRLIPVAKSVRKERVIVEGFGLKVIRH